MLKSSLLKLLSVFAAIAFIAGCGEDPPKGAAFSDNTPLVFKKDGSGLPALGAGWAPEDKLVGSSGKEATLLFQAPKKGARAPVVVLTVTPFVAPPRLKNQTVEATIAGTAVAKHVIDKPNSEIEIPLGEAKPGETVTITLKLPNAATPQSVGVNDDPRMLAIALFSARLKQ